MSPLPIPKFQVPSSKFQFASTSASNLNIIALTQPSSFSFFIFHFSFFLFPFSFFLFPSSSLPLIKPVVFQQIPSVPKSVTSINVSTQHLTSSASHAHNTQFTNVQERGQPSRSGSSKVPSHHFIFFNIFTTTLLQPSYRSEASTL